MHKLSLVSFALDILVDDIKLSSATGFLYRVENTVYLVSNWHVFSGRNTYTGQPIHHSAAIPNKFTFSLKNTQNGWIVGNSISLYDNNHRAIWLQHAKGQQYDLAAIPVLYCTEGSDWSRISPAAKIVDPSNSFFNWNSSSDQSLNAVIQPGMDLSIVGHPNGIAKQEGLPIWKRASIASEPELEADGLPIILVDTATRGGMSGSPVYQVFLGSVPDKNGGVTFYTGGGGLLCEFVGVYSGRYGAEDELAAQIGRVWKKSALDEMLANPVSGSYELKA